MTNIAYNVEILEKIGNSDFMWNQFGRNCHVSDFELSKIKIESLKRIEMAVCFT